MFEELENLGGAALADIPDVRGSDVFHGQRRSDFVLGDVVDFSLSNDDHDHRIRSRAVGFC